MTNFYKNYQILPIYKLKIMVYKIIRKEEKVFRK
nr:MAG TPA: hypothetical protein [Caudoviricetes sp.]